jgi:nucleoside-diphosphate-sugar epimerase
MAVLVTGGFGHIGSWVSRILLERGKDVIVLGRSRHRLSYLEDYSQRITFFPADVLDYASIFRLFEELRGDLEGVIHVAGLMGGPHFATNPHRNIRVNTFGTLDLLEACRIFGISRFVYVSSGSVYGKRDDVPDEDVPLSPSDVYGAAKASAELIGVQYGNEFGLDFRAVRVYFAYGPGKWPSELYPLYTAVFGALEGRDRVCLEAGRDQQLDFTYVRDIARAIVLLHESENVKSRVYNVSSGEWAPLPDLIRAVARYAGVSVDLEIGPGKLMPRGPSLGSTRIRDELGFKPEYSFADGVQAYAEWILAERTSRQERGSV